jgi:antitoxin (DNA-binding transcriptional repressor) of toxin-antitoxin stability system
MAQTVVNVHEAKTQLSKLLAKLDSGERVVIQRRGKPAVQLVRLEPERRLGWASGVIIRDDFDTLDSEIAEAFGA